MLWALLVSVVLALEPPLHADQGPTVPIGGADFGLVLPLDDALLEALREGRHSAAVAGLEAVDMASLRGEQVPVHAFLLAWSTVHAGAAADAEGLLPLLRTPPEGVPVDYLRLTSGEILVAAGRAAEGVAELDDVGEQSVLWPRAQLVRAKALYDLGRTSEARETYVALVARPDPAEGSDLALQALAQLAGLGTEASYPYERRLWAAYPRTAAGRQAEAHLKKYGPYPTWQDIALRGDQLMAAYRWQQAVDLLSKDSAKVSEPSPEACMYWYAHGRSLFKLNRLTESAQVLAPAGRACVGHDEDRGAKALYLAGKADERRKAWASAARHYSAVGELYPDHSYADDGFALAGIALQEAGDPKGARALWGEQVERWPTGDLAGEGYWRLAWGAYLAGDTPGAIAWAEEATARVPFASDPEHLRAARYWAARWRAWPNVDDPTTLSSDEAAVDEAIDGFASLCEEAPFSFYAQLASARLELLAPERIPQRPEIDPGDGWQVRAEFLDDPHTGAAVELFRLGLYREALVEIDAVGLDALSPGEVGYVIEQRWAADDWLLAHDALRTWLRIHPPEELGSQRDRLLILAYPDMYWELVQKAATGYGYDPRVFHALVREESNFNKDIVSHAGARGLSQLMPGTARSVARWLGFSVSQQQLHDPYTNLRIGSRYFESLSQRYRGNSYLSMAGYNAGEGNVKKWLDRFGNLPTDEWIESVPYRETRRYIKRVSRTWQTYHLLYDEGPIFPEGGDFVHVAVPDPDP
ncbi:MAG TPA: transglycosylase SLT domain-containing protein [Myxococcota bacterium]|nr:transglycosylase SLT domain-containing protein [Myxococcota bacterium]